jgi:rod shape-determining protein MreB
MEVEKCIVRETALHAGDRDMSLIQGPMAAAIGVGLPIDEPAVNIIVAIGGGTTEVAILSLNGVGFAHSIRIGGDEPDHNISDYVKCEYSLIIGEHIAEERKIKIDSAAPLDAKLSLSIKGRDAIIGLPRTINITSTEIRTELKDAIASITNVVKEVSEQCTPELSSDLVDRMIVLAGGGTMLKFLDILIAEETELPVLQDISIWFDNE